MSVTATAETPGSIDRGSCTPPALAEIIRDLYLEERSGTLVLSRSGAEKRVFLNRGMIVSASSSLEDEKLPAFLVQRNLIRAEEAEALKGLDDRQAAEILIDRGKVPPAALRQVIRDLTQQILSAAFRWDDLVYSFQEGAVTSGSMETDVIVSFELIIRALRLMSSFEAVKNAMLRQERAIAVSEESYLPFDQLGLTSIEGYLVSRIDGRTKPRDILSLVPPSEEEAAARFLFGLLILGLAQFIPPIGSGLLTCDDLVRGEAEKQQREERERVEVHDFYNLARTGDPWTILGVREDADQERVKAAYHERKSRFEPARFLKKVRMEMREELQIIEARLLEALLALGSRPLESPRLAAAGAERTPPSMTLEDMTLRKELAKSKKQSEEDKRTRLAEQFLTKARDYWKMNDFFSCIRYCEFAISHNDKDAASHSLLGQALQRNPDYRWQKRAEATLIRAADLEPFNPGHWVLLGEFYRAHGLPAKARKHFEKALEILPSHPEALQALAELPLSKH